MHDQSNYDESVNKRSLIQQIETKFANVFQEESNSYIKGFKVELELKDGVQPVFHRTCVNS